MGPDHPNTPQKKKISRVPLIVNALLLTLGNCGGPLIMRLYFLQGGKRVWLSSALETAGWPLNIFPLIYTYMSRRRNASIDGTSAKIILMDFPIFLAAAVVGILTGLDDFLYASGVSRLPVSTSQLIIASQLGFTALFAFLLVRQRFTAFTVNAVFLLTTGAAVLAIGTGSSRPDGESNREYYLGFGMTVLAAVLYGFVLPVIELIYARAKQTLTYTLVLEIQLVMCFFATAFCAVGMIINKDFQVIPREAREYGYGVAWYYVVLFLNALFWQCFFLGAIGVVFCASSLLSAILIAVGLPVTEVLAVIFYKERFSTEKGLSLVLSLWGFVSYFYGEMKQSKSRKRAENEELELPQIIGTHAS